MLRPGGQLTFPGRAIHRLSGPVPAVIAACGSWPMATRIFATRCRRFGMAGNYGPDSKMERPGGYTPNITWAEINVPTIVDMDGSGTRLPPQVAAPRRSGCRITS